MKVTPSTLTERHIARLLDGTKGDEFARLHRMSIAMEVEREPLASLAAQRICDAINARRARP